MDGIDLLVTQHRKLEGLLKQALDSADPLRQKILFQHGGDHLTIHIASEEEIFYPAVRQRRTEDILLESLEEHLSLKRLLSDLLSLQPGEQTFYPKLKVLEEQARHHHKEEEENLFPKVRKALTPSQLETLGSQMEALQVKLLREGEPREAVVEQTAEAAPLK